MIEFLMKRSGVLFLLSAPSGGGKSTILRAIRDADSSLAYSISATTRKPRATEKHGIDYYFFSVEEFKRLIAEGAFVEYAIVHGNYYGTLASEIDQRVGSGQDVLLDIDVQGSLRLKRERPDTVLLFILPPSIATLEKRLRNRGLDDEESMKVRLANARHEIRYAQHYDYVMVNVDLDQTVRNMQAIIAAERFRAHRIRLTDALGKIEFLPRSEAPIVNV